ncbi:hypothetical protein ABEB36_009469 [Hypothenemus hampei]|uniref:UBC core domain-containing protein n=1 Tax=Hypothenemus hampei TaxID=57062 RepID=A0ABD1EJD9_HYPHA
MAQDVYSKMAVDPLLLNEDGYLKVDTDVKDIIYHPSLNVILICTNTGIVRVLDVNSGVILQSSTLSAKNGNDIKCKYIPNEDRVLFCDGQALGVRSDYNGVLLLDSILQKTLFDPKENVKIELLLSEAVLFKQCLSNLKISNSEQVINELQNVILAAQQSQKKGIKAQKWNTACITLPIGDLKFVASTIVTDFVNQKIHTPELQVASAIKERISEILGEQTVVTDRKMMASEVRRRETFSQWPHMDYKWALPEQMAQAGFYHQPNSTGDDRAMCFTCSMCLVSWERSDEPWSEHERHSPTCPFVIGLYTQNVPIAVTNATAPAVEATNGGVNISVIGSSSISKLLPTCTHDGLVSVFDVSGKVKRTHSFFVTQFDSHILEKVTQDFCLPRFWNDEKKSLVQKSVTALAIVSNKPGIEQSELKSNIRPAIICGITISQGTITVAQDGNESSSMCKQIVTRDDFKDRSRAYLVVYDFTFTKEQENSDDKINGSKKGKSEPENSFNTQVEETANFEPLLNIIDLDVETFSEMGNTDECTLLKELTSFYKTLIPGESETVYLPPLVPDLTNMNKKSHGSPRLISVDVEGSELAEADSTSSTSDLMNHTFVNELNETTISDHIVDLKKNQSNKFIYNKLNYSRAVQCLNLPEECKRLSGLEITSILPTLDKSYVLVTLCDNGDNGKHFLLLYALDFTNKMVKIKEDIVNLKALPNNEKPLEINLLPASDKFKSPLGKTSQSVEGQVVLVCADGVVRIVDLFSMETICCAKIEGKKFVSAAYCNSLERLCTSTIEGSLHFFALNDGDNESVDDHDEDDLFGLNVDSSMKSLEKLEIVKCFKKPVEVISLQDLRALQKLMFFVPVRYLYNVVVPPCWSEFQQSMRQRRNSSTLNTEAFTKTWRLQTDTTTWEEHIFEITLPNAVVLGHVDVHFTLQNGCSRPCVEVSLLRQTKSGFGHGKDVKFSVDETVIIDMLGRVENPVVSEEYLRAHNADILAGPANISHFLDLTQQSGTVTLTSPRMFKTKVRNLLLHVRAVYDKDEKITKQSDSKTSIISIDKLGLPPRKSEQYLGCDCIHELSIAIYTPSAIPPIPHEKTLRNLMLNSNVFVKSLIKTATFSDNEESRQHVLDILNWVSAIRLTPARCSNGESPGDQLDFIISNIYEDNLTLFLQNCLLHASRNIAHKCMSFIITCIRGAKNINEQTSEIYNGIILKGLLDIFDNLKEVKSAAGLYWILALLLRVVDKNTESIVLRKCIRLLKKISDDLIGRSNPYHLLLRSRYGLYGSPTEPELFDIEPPSFAQGSSSTTLPSPFNYFSVNVAPSEDASAGVTAGPELYQQTSNKDPSYARDVSSDNKLKYRNAAFPKLIKGLIETEPLHFTCINASEGTRLEIADSTNSSSNTVQQTSLNNMAPFASYTLTTSKKEDLQQFIQKCVESSFTAYTNQLNDIVDKDKFAINMLLGEQGHSLEQKMEVVYKDLVDLVNSSKTNPIQPQNHLPSSSVIPPNPIVHQSPQPNTSNNNISDLPWQQLLMAPAKQVIVVERMHSGARRHVILDFGESISLTDVLIPYCPDLVMLTIDVWLLGEELDATRLATVNDIGTKNLILTDLQPPPLCKYMKITLLGRYGMSTTRCRIPLGYFFGHVVVLPEAIPNHVFIKPVDCERQLTLLSKLLEDISCRYSLACSKLKDYLHPFLVADTKNTLHLATYISILKDKKLNISNTEHGKIFSTYQETLTFQHQLNIVRNIMSRIQASISDVKNTKNPTEAPTDKLIAIAEGLLEVLLSIDSCANVNKDLCIQLFEGLCVAQPSRLQLLAAVFLEKACGTESFWGNFLSDTLVTLFSTSCTLVFPQDRLFILLIYLSRKSPERSTVIDAALRAVYNTLKPIEQGKPFLLAVNVDLSLLSWLLMYLSLQLTSGKEDNGRWDWVLGEMSGKVNGDTAKNNARKKTVKRVAPTLGTTGFVGNNISTYENANSLEKSTLMNFHKGAWMSVDAKDIKLTKLNVMKRTYGGEKDKSNDDNKDPTSLKDIMMFPQKMPQFVDFTHCLAVAKILIKFIIMMDHSGSADLVLLSFKIISKLLVMAKLNLCQLVTEDQLLELIKFSLACKVPWAPFALSCFLQDALDVQKHLASDTLEINSNPSTSNWPPSQNEIGNDQGPNEEYLPYYSDLEAELVDRSKSKEKSHSFPVLPSVFETDSNDSDIEEVLEAFEKVRCSGLKLSKLTAASTSLISTTIDARLETGVSAISEISLRRLSTRNTQKLLQNITNEKLKDIENPLISWPEVVGPFQPECTQGNLKMLSYCFNELFKNLQTMDPDSIDSILHLWLTLNCARRDEIFDSSAIPLVQIEIDSVSALISALARAPGLSLTTWCLGLQALTLVCNTSTNEKKWFDLSGMADVIVRHRDFVQMIISLLSGSGVAFTDKGAAGPTLCKALHDFLVRLQVRCDIVSQSSRLGNLFKKLLLDLVYQMTKPGGPISSRTGPLDAQCKLLQSISYLDFTNIDYSIGMSMLESTSVLLNSYFVNIDNIKCVTMGDKRYVYSNTFSEIFAGVLGTDPNKQDRPVSYEDLLISLLKLLMKLVQNHIPYNCDNLGRGTMDLNESAGSQTDESKAEQIQQTRMDNWASRTNLSFADTALQHLPTIVSLLKCLACCKSSSICMLSTLSQQAFTNFGEPNTVSDAIFYLLSSLVRKATRKDQIIEPLLMFLSQTPQLSEPFIWFVLQVLDNEESIKAFYNHDGIQVLASSVVNSSNTPVSISRNGTISTLMQHFNGFTGQNDVQVLITPTSANKMLQASFENNSLINFAPYCTITCQSRTSQPAEVLIQGLSGVTHRRARTPLWSYNYYQEETHTELLLQLPNAVLLKEVHLQPHAGGLATCPSFVAIETSANGPSRLVPACHPLPTSGLTYIRLHLPTAKVVNCVLIRLYKPRVGNSIGLLQLRLLGTYALGKTIRSNNENDDAIHCNHSLGWLRLLNHCFTISIDSGLKQQIINSASQIPHLLSTCCGLLLVPSHISPVYLPCLENMLRELALLTPENGVEIIRILLDNRLNIIEPMMTLDNSWQDRLMINVSGYQSACELLYQICEHQDPNTEDRIKMLLDWLKRTVEECLQIGDTTKCSPAYVSSIASILWFGKESAVSYDLQSLISLELFDLIYNLKMKTTNRSLKYVLDSLLCSLCYNKSEFFPLLLRKIGVLVPNLSTDMDASISDDRKDTQAMTDDGKQDYINSSQWYNHLTIGELSELNLTNEQLETVALASRSPTAIQQLLDSGLPKLLNNVIYEFCNSNDENTNVPMAKLEKVTAILQFFTNVCDEKTLRDWLGSPDGSSFWPYLLHWLCKKPFGISTIQSEAHVHLEEVCVKFLSKCCLCHPNNRIRLATVLCDVISQQQNGISGFLRRLILQLLLENEKVPVSIEADQTLYKTSHTAQVYVPAHPAFKQTYNRIMLYLSTTTTIGDILEQHLFFNAVYKPDISNKKPPSVTKKDVMHFKEFFPTEYSDLSVAAGVTAKDKRAKDIKNIVASTPKKKRYTNDISGATELMDGRTIKCLACLDQPLPMNLNLSQLLQLTESKGSTNDWPCIHLTICHSNEDKNQEKDVNGKLAQQQESMPSALQVFSSLGGLALLAQNLPTVYPETVRVSTQEKSVSDQSDSEWIKLEETDDAYEDIEEWAGNNSPSKVNTGISYIPPHSLTAFSLFLRLPGYAEVLLKDTRKAQCILRLMLGVTDDGEGGDIFQSPIASTLPTLPFQVLQTLYDSSPLCSDDGRLLRRISISNGVIQLLLACLGILTHQAPSGGTEKEQQRDLKNQEERQLYWAKGTGFGTGSTQQSWNVEQALIKQKNEEEHVSVLLQVLASYINPNDGDDEELNGNVLPPQFYDFLARSALLPAISSYLRNDSVLDMARHIPLYKAVLKILRALALSSQLVKLLLPQGTKRNEPSVSSLLKSMKTCVDTYANKLKIQNTKAEKAGKATKSGILIDKIDDLEQGEGLATLMPDIQNTANLVAKVTFGMMDESDSIGESSLDAHVIISPEERYLHIMKDLQFASYEMIEEQADGNVRFVVSHHFESMARAASDQSHPARVKRIAQETVTLSTSLPLSYSSSVFVRYDSSRLDVMKVLITGPADTPYTNGCFEFDVFFPPDYPLSPMLINLETTGHHTVRFNPNLYNDGKVCLSVKFLFEMIQNVICSFMQFFNKVLNTWHGRPEEKWNAQTSSFLQVLVSIQSLILVPEPYFNEPGYERARGTPAGTANSKDYNHNICQATVRWAMLDQILNPCPCFKDVINTHFYMKRHEILAQVEKWIDELEQDSKKEKKSGRVQKKNRTASLDSFKKVYKQLQEQLAKLKLPGESLESMETDAVHGDEDEESPTTPTNSMDVTTLEQDENVDQEMEKIVEDKCK